MTIKFNIALTAVVTILSMQANAQVIFYEHENFEGRKFSTESQVVDFVRYGFNDRASSVIVLHDNWEVCQDSKFRGQCMVLRPGRYSSLRSMGMDKMISSVRQLANDRDTDERRYAPAPIPVYDNHRREREQLFDANVTSVRAVVGSPQQRCWIEQQQIERSRSQPNVPGALVGALIGGVLGHQVGGGSGRDIATAGGAVAGAVVGSNAGRDKEDPNVYTQDVQRCTSTQNQARPEYWDVTYNFRGREHHMQMTTPPGATVTVNENGEPRS